MEKTNFCNLPDLEVHFGDRFVFDKAWQSGDSKILSDLQRSFYDWISDEEEAFEGKVE